MSVVELILVIAGSVGVGVLGGILGVGGGVFLVPFLIFVADLGPKEAVAVSLCCVIGTSASASVVSGKSGIARLDVALRLEPALVLGAVIASALAVKVNDGAVLVGFGVLLVLIAVLVIVRSRAHVDVDQPLSPLRRVVLVIAGFFSGAASGLFGVGGGVLVVPSLTLIGRMPLKAAASTSSLCLMSSAACGALVHWSHGLLRMDIVAAVMLGVLPGGLIGARWQRRLDERVLHASFFTLAVIVAGLSITRGLSA